MASSYDPPSLVNTLRVLAVSADKPFAEPGESVHLEMLLADPNGDGRPVQIAWGLCVNPGSAEIGACADSVVSFQTSGESFEFTVPDSALDAVPPEAPVGSVGVVFAACAGTITAQRTPLSPVRCQNSAGADVGRSGFVWGEKRVTVVRGLRNHTPLLARLRVDGVIWPADEVRALRSCDAASVADCSGEGQHALQLDVALASFEHYFGQTEDLVGFFFTSQGELRDDFLRPDADGTLLTVLALDKPDAARPVLLWFVVRDDRGGMSFTSRRARVQ